MKKVDKTKENIGVENLDDLTKKELFEKFVSAGGEVIQEKRRQGFTDFDREKQKKHRELIDEKREKLKAKIPEPSTRKPVQPTVKTAKRPPQVKKSGGIARFFERFIIKLRLSFMGVTDLSGTTFKSKFINRFNIEYSPSLMEMQILYLDTFKKNHQMANLILDRLDKIKLIYFELIEKIASIYDRGTINKIVGEYKTTIDSQRRVLELKEPLTIIFKKLYILHKYQESILFAYERSINIQAQIEKDKSSLYSSKRKKAKNSIYILFNKLFPALYWLFCNYQGRIIPLSEPVIEKILNITDDDKIGKRVTPTKPKDTQEEESTEEKAQTEEAKLPDNIKKGIELMYKLDLSRLREEYDKEQIFRNVKENDKILITYLLFQEFDQEYSFILTTNKIKYRAVFTHSGKIDHRLILSDLYNEQRKCIEAFKEYTLKLESFEKSKLDKPINNVQYIEYTKKLTSLEKEKKRLGRNTRMIVKAFMDKVSDEFKILIDDMESDQKIVENPQDELTFNTEIEGNRKLNKLKIYEAIHHAYYYASALAYRLGAEGDLSGDLEFKEGEETLTDEKDTSQPQKEKEEEKSVIDELDDLL